MADAHPAAMFTGGNAADNHAQWSLPSGEWRLAQLVAMQVDVWTAGYVEACAALHEVRLVRMPQ